MKSLAKRWHSYFIAESQTERKTAGTQDTLTQPVTIDLVELYRTDQELSQAVLSHPDRVLPEARAVLCELADLSPPVQLQVQNNPQLCAVSEVSAHQCYELVTVNGMVDSVGPIEAAPVSACYTCPACDASLRTSSAGIAREEPITCTDCEWNGDFAFHPAESAFIDTQQFTLCSKPDQRNNHPHRESLSVYLRGSLVGQVTADDHVIVSGVLRLDHTPETSPCTPYLEGYGLRGERDISPPESLEAAIDSYWKNTQTTPPDDNGY